MLRSITIYGNTFIQAIFLVWAMTLLLGEKVNIKRIISYALVSGISVPFARSIYNYVEVPFYTHSVILMFWAILLYRFIVKMSWLKATIASLLAMVIIFIVDGLVVFQVMRAFNITIEQLQTDIVTATLIISITSIAFIAIIVLNKLTGFALFKPEE